MNDPMMVIADQFADIDKRLRTIEGGQRIGLASVRTTWMTAAATQVVFGSWDNVGPVAATWENDAGQTGTGWPEVLVRSGKRVLIIWSARIIGMATEATRRSSACNGAVIANGFGFSPLNPSILRQVFNGNSGSMDIAVTAAAIKTVAAGDNMYKFAASFTDNIPAAVNLPTVTDVSVTIIPLGFS